MIIKIKERNIPDGRYAFGGAALLLSPFAKIISATLFVMLLGSSGFGVWKVIENKNLEIDLLNAQNSLIHKQNEFDKCKSAIQSQNQKILEFQENIDDIAEIKKREDELKRENTLLRVEIDNLKSQDAPETCEESAELLRNNLNIFDGGVEK